MKKNLIVALAMGALAMLPNAATRVIPTTETVSAQVKRRKMNKTANKINVFYGYPSERKGKGQKKREASQRRKRGWC